MLSADAGAKLASCRKIWKRIRNGYEQTIFYAERAKLKPGYNPETSMAADSLRIETAWLVGDSVPVGCIPEYWREACRLQLLRYPLPEGVTV